MCLLVSNSVQVSLTSKLKKQLTLRSKSSKIYDVQRSYHFIQMRGPKLKGFAEMAVIKRDASYFDQPGRFSYSIESPSNESSKSDSHTDTFRQSSHPVADSIDSTSGINGSQKVPPASSLATGGGGSSQGGSVQRGGYSPKLRQAFLGQSSGATSTKEGFEKDQVSLLSHSSSVGQGSCSSQTGLIQSPSVPQDEGRDTGCTNPLSEMGINSDEFDQMMASSGEADSNYHDEMGVAYRVGRGHSQAPQKYDKLSKNHSKHPTETKSRGKCKL